MSENVEDFEFLEELLVGSEDNFKKSTEKIKQNKVENEQSKIKNEKKIEEKREIEELEREQFLDFEEEDRQRDALRRQAKASPPSYLPSNIDTVSNDVFKRETKADEEDGFAPVYEDENYDDEMNEFHEEEYEGLSPAMRAALEWRPPEPKSTDEALVNEWIQTGWVGHLHIDQILTEAILTGASDVHITADIKTSMTRNGDIIRYNDYVIPDEEVMHTLIHDAILTHQQQQTFNRDYEYEGAYTLMYGPFAGRRTRLTIGKTFGKYFMVFRIISEHIPTLEELKIEEEIVKWSHYPNGLFLLCGPTGSGKSTTLASVLRNLQMTTQKKIISVEKPIEYIYPDNGPSLVVQRDVGEDTRGFYEGLTSAMRQSPNVILLGEVRNTEEVTELLRAAETGHLAISTMHTNSVATTINRIQNLFSGNEQRRIMSTLADTMRGIGNQVLVKTMDGEGRFAVRELLTINDEIKKLIIAGDIQGIRDYQVRNKATMEHKLAEAVKAGKCSYENALNQTADPILFNNLINE